MSPNRRLAAVIQGAPIAVMCGIFLSPLLLFWLWIWGPLRPFDIAPVPAPSMLAFFGGLAACIFAARVPAWYFTVRPFERDGRVYRWIGVRVFRKFVPDGDVVNRARRRQDRHFRLIRSSADSLAWLLRTEASERSHLVLMFVGLLSAGYAAYVGWTAWAMLLTAGNLVANVYPVLLQRYNRARLVRLRSRRASSLSRSDA
jgi:Glycosyl-4,4'-diaponeurosporenoate acyltransferase